MMATLAFNELIIFFGISEKNFAKLFKFYLRSSSILIRYLVQSQTVSKLSTLFLSFQLLQCFTLFVISVFFPIKAIILNRKAISLKKFWESKKFETKDLCKSVCKLWKLWTQKNLSIYFDDGSIFYIRKIGQLQKKKKEYEINSE